MMERQSTQHSPRVDEAMERETRSLTHGSPIEAREQEWRLMEGPADGEPLPDAVISMDDVELRSLLAASLRPSAFPGDRGALLEVAGEEHADPLIVDLLHALPADRVFATPEEVWEQLGGKVEVREHPEPPRTLSTTPETQPDTEPAQPDLDAASAPLVVKGAVLAISVSVGAAALAIAVVREVCGRLRRVI
jgi:hypothetical protein